MDCYYEIDSYVTREGLQAMGAALAPGRGVQRATRAAQFATALLFFAAALAPALSSVWGGLLLQAAFFLLGLTVLALALFWEGLLPRLYCRKNSPLLGRQHLMLGRRQLICTAGGREWRLVYAEVVRAREQGGVIYLSDGARHLAVDRRGLPLEQAQEIAALMHRKLPGGVWG